RQLIDIGGYRLHLYCMGESSDGSPTVILEQGLGGTSPAWALVQPEVAKVTRVCAYDRAGLGWSDPAPKGTPRDGEEVAKELHTLLQKADIAGPYVMVGHSSGGLYALFFAHQYSKDVVGLVLLDSSHPDQWDTSVAQELYKSNARIYSVTSTLARLGLLRLRARSQPALGLPDLQNQELMAFGSATQDWDAQGAEFFATMDLDDEVRAAGSLGNLPLLVLTATDHGGPADMEQTWQGLQNELAQLSTNSVHKVLNGARHESLWADPEYAGESVTAILNVVEAAQYGTPLQK
ncbi:MAG TPA: alpha/beta hydrolase, partial [Anaerolineales bacterium]|nr:alpha/beta hydrolase [Anaerolineales bacterium]